MKGDSLIRQLDRWREALLLTEDQADAILAFERESSEVESPDRGQLTLVEAFAYLGAVVALAGIAILLVTRYADLGGAGRLGILGMVTGSALAAAALLSRSPIQGAAHRARAAALGLFDLGVAALCFQVQIELLGGRPEAIAHLEGSRVLLVAAVVGSLVAAGLLAWTGDGLLAALLALGTYFSGAAFLTYAVTSPPSPWVQEGVFLVCAALLLIAAELNRRVSRRWAAEILAFAAFLIPPLVAYTSAAGDQDIALELVGGAIALLAFGAAVVRSSPGYAIAGAVGVFGFLLELQLRHFQSSLGFALVLITSGLALVALSYLTARLIPRLGSQ